MFVPTFPIFHNDTGGNTPQYRSGQAPHSRACLFCQYCPLNTHTKPSSSGLRVSDGFGAERYEDCAGNRAEAVRGSSHDSLTARIPLNPKPRGPRSQRFSTKRQSVHPSGAEIPLAVVADLPSGSTFGYSGDGSAVYLPSGYTFGGGGGSTHRIYPTYLHTFGGGGGSGCCSNQSGRNSIPASLRVWRV